MLNPPKNDSSCQPWIKPQTAVELGGYNWEGTIEVLDYD